MHHLIQFADGSTSVEHTTSIRTPVGVRADYAWRGVAVDVTRAPCNVGCNKIVNLSDYRR